MNVYPPNNTNEMVAKRVFMASTGGSVQSTQSARPDVFSGQSSKPLKGTHSPSNSCLGNGGKWQWQGGSGGMGPANPAQWQSAGPRSLNHGWQFMRWVNASQPMYSYNMSIPYGLMLFPSYSWHPVSMITGVIYVNGHGRT
jgi:hypothetical protein